MESISVTLAGTGAVESVTCTVKTYVMALVGRLVGEDTHLVAQVSPGGSCEPAATVH